MVSSQRSKILRGWWYLGEARDGGWVNESVGMRADGRIDRQMDGFVDR